MKPQTIRVLLIEDDLGDAQKACKLLSGAGVGRFHLEHVEQLGCALRRLREDHFDAVLLALGAMGDIAASTPAELERPAGWGLEAISSIQEAAPQAAIVVLSPAVDEALSLEAIQAGAQDFLVKWQGDGFLLARSLCYAVGHKREKDRLTRLACYDALTGLVNRSFFRELLDQALRRAARNDHTMALMFLDLDNFKVINDTLGHDVGDSLLRLVAQRLQGCVRTTDVIARLGGDEFTVLQERVERLEDIETVARKILQVMDQPFVLDHHELFVGTSIGIALYPGHGRDAETLLKNADTAMYHAKERGRHNYQFYLSVMGEQAHQRLQLERNLHHALRRNELQVYFQPQLHLGEGKVVGAEALLRWRPTGEAHLLRPREFMAVAEETGLIVPIGEWLVETVCAQYRHWRESGLPPMRVALNLSARQLRHPDLLPVITAALQRHGMEGRCLTVELNEGLMMESMASNCSILHKLKGMGVHIAIDNFGSGSFSLSCLKNLPVDTIKIDKSFIQGCEKGGVDGAIVSAIITLAHSLGLQVVAEGVENDRQVQALREKGCQVVQGNHICPPLAADDFLPQLAARSLEPMAGTACGKPVGNLSGSLSGGLGSLSGPSLEEQRSVGRLT